MPRKRKSRLYWRQGRAWGDFRDYADVGGRREALVPGGAAYATHDLDVAHALLQGRLKELEGRRRNKAILGRADSAPLEAFAAAHLVEKRRAGTSTHHLQNLEHRLRVAVGYFGVDRLLDAITPADMKGYLVWLRQVEGRRGRLAPGTVRHYLMAISNLYRSAQEAEAVDQGFNPVAALVGIPGVRTTEARWLEVDKAAAFLEACRHVMSDLPIYAIVATCLLTGGRKAEVLGLDREDVSFPRSLVTFRPHGHRGLKTDTSIRTVALWPQLAGILEGHVATLPEKAGLLFPSPRTGRMINDLRKALDGACARLGWPKGFVGTRIFRHTYCAARLQTLDRGAPVSRFTVSRELGHGGTRLVDRVYGHLGTFRHRLEVVEYRVGPSGGGP